MKNIIQNYAKNEAEHYIVDYKKILKESLLEKSTNYESFASFKLTNEYQMIINQIQYRYYHKVALKMIAEVDRRFNSELVKLFNKSLAKTKLDYHSLNEVLNIANVATNLYKLLRDETIDFSELFDYQKNLVIEATVDIEEDLTIETISDLQDESKMIVDEFNKAKLNIETKPNHKADFEVIHTLASRFDYLPAIIFMANYYETKLNNLKEALAWYLKAVKRNDVDATLKVAELLDNNHELKADYPANSYYETAAINGSSKAAIHLAEFAFKMHMLNKALKYYDLALKNGTSSVYEKILKIKKLKLYNENEDNLKCLNIGAIKEPSLFYRTYLFLIHQEIKNHGYLDNEAIELPEILDYGHQILANYLESHSLNTKNLGLIQANYRKMNSLMFETGIILSNYWKKNNNALEEYYTKQLITNNNDTKRLSLEILEDKYHLNQEDLKEMETTIFDNYCHILNIYHDEQESEAYIHQMLLASFELGTSLCA